MSTMTPNTSETSVTFSLAELAKLEEARVREEDVRRARVRDAEAREQREAAARRRGEEEAQIAAEAAARTRRLREEAEEKARAEARARAALDVARIEAEGKARLEADNAARAHELSLVRARTEGGARRTVVALAAALGLALCGGGVATYQASQRVAGLEQDAERLRDAQAALGKEREHAKTTELAALDRRHAALRARPLAREAEEAGKTADAARSAIDTSALDHDRLRAFGDALDALEARMDTLERLAALDRRRADLTAWAADRKKGELADEAQRAAALAKATAGDERSLRAYEAALDKLRGAIARPAAGGRVSAPWQAAPGGVCLAGDPSCDLNGHPLF